MKEPLSPEEIEILSALLARLIETTTEKISRNAKSLMDLITRDKYK